MLYEPTRIRRKAKADAEAKITVAKAEIQQDELARRAAQRLTFQEVTRQSNIDAVVDGALEQLPESASPTPVSQDWISQFFDACCDVSNSQMQQIWSRLLAGEVTAPGSFSPRTLSTVKHMRPEDASLFTTLVGLSWSLPNEPLFVLRPLKYNTASGSSELSWGDCLALSSLGLLHLEESVIDIEPSTTIVYGEHRHVMTVSARRRFTPFWSKHIDVYCLTLPAQELARLVDPVRDLQAYDKSRQVISETAAVDLVRCDSPPDQGS